MTTITSQFALTRGGAWITENWNACELTLGSQKQIAWAQNIRHELVTDFAIFANDHKGNAQIAGLHKELEAILISRNDARFWIDNQDFRSAIKACRPQ